MDSTSQQETNVYGLSNFHLSHRARCRYLHICAYITLVLIQIIRYEGQKFLPDEMPSIQIRKDVKNAYLLKMKAQPNILFSFLSLCLPHNDVTIVIVWLNILE